MVKAKVVGVSASTVEQDAVAGNVGWEITTTQETIGVGDIGDTEENVVSPSRRQSREVGGVGVKAVREIHVLEQRRAVKKVVPHAPVSGPVVVQFVRTADESAVVEVHVQRVALFNQKGSTFKEAVGQVER